MTKFEEHKIFSFHVIDMEFRGHETIVQCFQSDVTTKLKILGWLHHLL